MSEIINNEEFTMIEACDIDSDWARKVASWVKIARAYDEETNALASIMIENFTTAASFRYNHKHIKRAILEGFTDEDKEIMAITNTFLHKKSKNEEQNALMKDRNKIINTVNRLYGRLGNETFGDAFKTEIPSPDTRSTTSSASKRKASGNQTPQNTPQQTPQHNPQTPKSSLSSITNDDTDNESPGIDMFGTFTKSSEEMNEPFEEVNPKYEDGKQEPRGKYAHQKKRGKTQQDLFETLPAITNAVIQTFEKRHYPFEKLRVFEPCAGHGAITNEFKKLGCQVIDRDLMTMPESHDVLKTDFPDYDVLITNPPFSLKYEILEKCIKTGKEFVLLIPLDMIATKKWMKVMDGHTFHLQVLNPVPKFIHDKKEVSVAACAWLYCGGQFATETSQITNFDWRKNTVCENAEEIAEEENEDEED